MALFQDMLSLSSTFHSLPRRLLPEPPRRRLAVKRPRSICRASWQELAGVLVFSAIPFTAVKAIANSSLGESLRRRLEEKKKEAVENASRFNAKAQKARADSKWYGQERPRWFGPIPYDYPPYLTGELPGDYGFDIAGLGKDRLNFDKYFNFEILHARWAMLAALGALIPEVFDLTGAFHFVEPVWWRVGYSKLQCRCTLPTIQLMSFEVSPVLVLRVIPTQEDCTVELLSCKLEGSELLENQSEMFSAIMTNCMTWNMEDPEPFLEVDVSLKVTLEISTRPFTMLPVSAVEAPGNLVMQTLVDTLVPLLLQQLLKDYDEWIQKQQQKFLN